MRDNFSFPVRFLVCIAIAILSLLNQLFAQPLLGLDEKQFLLKLKEERVKTRSFKMPDKSKVYYTSKGDIMLMWQIDHGIVCTYIIKFDESSSYYSFIVYLDEQFERPDPAVRIWEINDMVVMEDIIDGKFTLLFLPRESRE